MNKVKTDEFLTLSRSYPVFDVRSPGEYGHAHIPGAYNLPLFSDEERRVVGTAYKQQGREQAIKTGLDYFGGKMRKMVEEAEEVNSQYKKLTPGDQQTTRTVLVHCWRGGMRSAGVAWLLDLYGFRVYTLTGGYKAFRNWVLQQFDKTYPFKVVGGYTGSGKTMVLQELEKKQHTVINLEGIAHHRGSAFGDLGEEKQPTQEMFENILGLALADTDGSNAIWLEDESRRIGNLNLPSGMWNTIRQSPVYFLEAPFEERLEYVTAEYGKYKKEELVNATMRIRKRLGGRNTKDTVNYLLEDNTKEAFRILLAYYDKYYMHGLHGRENLKELLTAVPCTHVNAKQNTEAILSAYEAFHTTKQ